MPKRPDIQIIPMQEGKPPPSVTDRRPLTTMPGFELYNQPRRKIEYLVNRLIPAGSKFVLSGTRAVWKSWTLTSLAICVASLEPFMGRFAISPTETTVGGSVLFVQLEEPIFEAQRKYIWSLAGMGLNRDPRRIQDLLVEYIAGQPFALDHPGRLDELKHVIDKLKPDLVLWDSLRRVMTGKSNDDDFAERLVRMLDELQAVFPSAHGVVAHWRKKSGDKELNEADERVRGTGAIVDQCDVHISIERNRADDYATMTQHKNRMGQEYGGFNFRMQIADAEGLACPIWIGKIDDSTNVEESGAAAEILKLLEADRRVWKQTEVANHPDIKHRYSADQVRYGVDSLERRRKITVERLGSGRSPLLQFREPLQS